MNNKRQYYQTETIIEALQMSGGIVAYAAQKLLITRQTLAIWIENEPELQEACANIVEEMLDLTEAKLVELIKDKNPESIRFFLRCKGKRRGWGDTVQVSGPHGGPVQIAATVTTPEEFEELARRLAEEI